MHPIAHRACCNDHASACIHHQTRFLSGSYVQWGGECCREQRCNVRCPELQLRLRGSLSRNMNIDYVHRAHDVVSCTAYIEPSAEQG
jgi:hypothetical protein